MIIKKFISSRLIIATSIIIIISSSSVRKEKKKNRKILLVVFFFSNLILSSIEAKKKNRKLIFIDYFLEISSISSYFLLIVSFFSQFDFSFSDVLSFFCRFVSSKLFVERTSFFLSMSSFIVSFRCSLSI